MEQEKVFNALVIEKDGKVRELVETLLKKRNYSLEFLSNSYEAILFLKENNCPIAILGDTDDNADPFEAMKKIVPASPMTSLILITDEEKEKVDDTAEGYGILGHVKRTIPADQLTPLLAQFEAICAVLSPPAC